MCHDADCRLSQVCQPCFGVAMVVGEAFLRPSRPFIRCPAHGGLLCTSAASEKSIRERTCARAFPEACPHGFVKGCTRACRSTHLCICVDAYMYTCINVYTCMHAYMCVCIYIMEDRGLWGRFFAPSRKQTCRFTLAKRLFLQTRASRLDETHICCYHRSMFQKMSTTPQRGSHFWQEPYMNSGTDSDSKTTFY